MKYNYIIKNKKENSNKIFRFPIITIMGHVDHGKTSILECLKKTKILDYEKGNITQNIKAYQINTKFGTIIIIDTPGHDSFIKMREKGSKITDIIILVISADDGIKKQTIESINYIINFNIPTIIVINKIDKGFNNINNIKKDLSKYNLASEDWGGNNKYVYISAKLNKGVDDLLNEIEKKVYTLDLEITKKNNLEAFVIESYINDKKGPSLYTLVKNGSIKLGDFIVCDDQYGKVKFINNEFGEKINHTISSLPSYIYGINKIPTSNKNIIIAKNIKEAKKISENNKKKYLLNNNNKLIYTISNLEKNIQNSLEERNNYILNYIIKVDTYGSYEAIKNYIDYLLKFKEKILINIIYFGIGSITINDIKLSYYSKSKLIGFNVKLGNKEINLIKIKNLYFNNFFIIYDLIKEIENDVEKLIFSNKESDFSKGLAKIYNVFSSSKNITIIGCKIISGRIKNCSTIKILRNNLLIYKGKIFYLKFLKNNILKAEEGTECGISVKENYNFKKNDIVMSN